MAERFEDDPILVADLVRKLHRQVGDRLQQEQAARRDRGQRVLTGPDEQQYSRALIAQVLNEHAETMLNAGQEPFDDAVDLRLSEAVHARMYGAGPLQALLNEDSIENVDINGCDEVWIHRADGTKERGAPVAASDEELIELIQQLASYAGRSSRPFDAANAQLDLRLPDGSRLSAIQGVSGRPSVSIRRHRFEKVTLGDLVGNNTLSAEAAAFLTAAVRGRFNILIAGGTDSGKTTMLRALASEIPPEERVVTVENSLELGLRADTARHPDCVELEARLENSEGGGQIAVDELVRRSLRMNPSRVIVGEVLGPEIITMLNAMSQGNDGSLSTLHARSAKESFERMATYALTSQARMPREATFSLIAGGLDFVIFLEKDRRLGPSAPGASAPATFQRRLSQIIEINGYDPSLGVPSSSELFLRDGQDMAWWTGVQPARVEGLHAAGWVPPGMVGGDRR